MSKRRYTSFQHVVENLTKNFAYSADNISQHPGYKFNYFNSFKELDTYFKQEFGEDWRQQEWARFWIREHNRTETREYDRAGINDRGVQHRQRIQGSIRHTRAIEGPKQLHKRITPTVLAAFIQELKEQEVLSLREVANAIKQKYNIKLHYSTVRRIKKKYNI